MILMNGKIFSVDFVGDLAFFKKNDTNDMVHISYNYIHRLAVLGMLGAILGKAGYAKSGEGRMPQYYEELKDLKIGIIPHYEKPLKKIITGFNNASGLGSDDGIWQVKEQILVGEPEIKYTIFIISNADITEDLIKKLEYYKTEYPLYFGKNEFFAHYEKYKEYDHKVLESGEYQIHSLVKKGNNTEIVFKEPSFDDFDPFDLSENPGTTIYESLPYDFDDMGFYEKDLFIWTQNKLILNNPKDFFNLRNNGEEFNVQFI